ncbi:MULTISPECIES: hypothetical protein [Gordonia]|uniref:hypothetical protein n=1 Tax=Gordonia TaxID=2053 RepID=UPI001EF4AAB2|nr:hypothetical protein [Gordonia sp. McavH-238-E]
MDLHETGCTKDVGYPIELYDGNDTRITANKVAALLAHNCSDAGRGRLGHGFTRPVALFDPKHNDSATIAFRDAGATVYNGIAGRPVVVLECALGELAPIKVRRFSVPATLLLGRAGTAMLRSLAGRRVRLRDAALHPLVVVRFLTILSPPADEAVPHVTRPNSAVSA